MTLLSSVLISIRSGKFFREDHEIYVLSKAEVTELPLSDWYGGVVVLQCIAHDFLKLDVEQYWVK